MWWNLLICEEDIKRKRLAIGDIQKILEKETNNPRKIQIIEEKDTKNRKELQIIEERYKQFMRQKRMEDANN